MLMGETQLAIIGAGPAGVSAAIAAASAGVDITVIDENPRIGGQIFRRMPETFQIEDSQGGVKGRKSFWRTEQKGQDLFAQVAKYNIEFRLETTVWGIFHPLTLALQAANQAEILIPQKLIIATGAYDRPIPFPGWTLPGVITAGAAQTLIKSQAVLPGQRVILAGSGPFLLPVAAQLISGGAEVVAILEASHPSRWMRKLPSLWGQWERFGEALEYLKVIHSVDVPIHFGQTIVAAHGDGFLREVTIAELDAAWRPVPGTKRRLTTDVACIGFGFIPLTQLSRLCGCAHVYRSEAGGWVVAHDEFQRTSHPDVFVAGESTGISGADVAMAQGAIAGLCAAHDLGAISEAEALRRAAPYRQRLQRLRPFVTMLRTLFSPRCGLLEVITDETLICRCEEVTAGSIRGAIRNGADDVNAVKARTRVGMGLCQGRICERIVAEIIASETGKPVDTVGAFTARPIIKPVGLAEIAKIPLN